MRHRNRIVFGSLFVLGACLLPLACAQKAEAKASNVYLISKITVSSAYNEAKAVYNWQYNEKGQMRAQSMSESERDRDHVGVMGFKLKNGALSLNGKKSAFVFDQTKKSGRLTKTVVYHKVGGEKAATIKITYKKMKLSAKNKKAAKKQQKILFTEGLEFYYDTEKIRAVKQLAAEVSKERKKLRAEDASFYQLKTGFFYESIPKDVKKRMNGKSYKKNKNIGWSDLRYLRVLHYGYHGEIRTGEMVVNKKVAKKVLKIFAELYKKKYPIQKMVLIDEYDADDETSMSDNNTSAFNYRVVDGTTTLSDHAFGLAIDLNPKTNPWVRGEVVSPANGKVYANRSVKKCKGKYAAYMIHKNDVCYKIFKKYGFAWAGNWHSPKDYQHFYYVK